MIDTSIDRQIENGWMDSIPAVGREGRLQARFPRFALQRFDQTRFLTANVRAGAAVDVHVEVVPALTGVLTCGGAHTANRATTRHTAQHSHEAHTTAQPRGTHHSTATRHTPQHSHEAHSTAQPRGTHHSTATGYGLRRAVGVGGCGLGGAVGVSGQKKAAEANGKAYRSDGRRRPPQRPALSSSLRARTHRGCKYTLRSQRQSQRHHARNTGANTRQSVGQSVSQSLSQSVSGHGHIHQCSAVLKRSALRRSEECECECEYEYQPWPPWRILRADTPR